MGLERDAQMAVVTRFVLVERVMDQVVVMLWSMKLVGIDLCLVLVLGIGIETEYQALMLVTSLVSLVRV